MDESICVFNFIIDLIPQHSTTLLILGEIEEEASNLSNSHHETSPRCSGILVVRHESPKSMTNGVLLADIHFAIKVLSVDVRSSLVTFSVDESSALDEIISPGNGDSVLTRGAELRETRIFAFDVMTSGDDLGAAVHEHSPGVIIRWSVKLKYTFRKPFILTI